jgi:hypothetical protein
MEALGLETGILCRASGSICNWESSSRLLCYTEITHLFSRSVCGNSLASWVSRNMHMCGCGCRAYCCSWHTCNPCCIVVEGKLMHCCPMSAKLIHRSTILYDNGVKDFLSLFQCTCCLQSGDVKVVPCRYLP